MCPPPLKKLRAATEQYVFINCCTNNIFYTITKLKSNIRQIRTKKVKIQTHKIDLQNLGHSHKTSHKHIKNIISVLNPYELSITSIAKHQHVKTLTVSRHHQGNTNL